jgi:hypothetical protein
MSPSDQTHRPLSVQARCGYDENRRSMAEQVAHEQVALRRVATLPARYQCHTELDDLRVR